MDAGKKPARKSPDASPASATRRKFINSVPPLPAVAVCWRWARGSTRAVPRPCRPRHCVRPAPCPSTISCRPACAAAVRARLPLRHLKLSDLGDPVATGTPYFHARQVPCEMCEDIPCVKACPTGALDRALTDINKAQMGLAALVDHESCLNFLGLRCDVCYRVCPVIDKAITLETQHNPRSDRHAMLLPTVHSDACTGCGKCEKSCVLPVAAIKVFPRELAQGALPATTARAGRKRPATAAR
jgi:ferredoxin-type protein NapG